MTVLTVGIAVVLGVIIGSFLNVVITRVPEGLSIVSPRSKCPVCQQEIAKRDNIPIVSWLILRGRCRGCGTPIPVFYPVVEVVSGLLWGAIAAWASIADRLLDPFVWTSLLLATVLLALTVIDLRTHRLPRALVMPLYPLVVVGLLLDQLAGPSVGGDAWGAVIGLAVWTGLIGGLWWLSSGRGMGFGDVTLAPVLGATLGWLSVGVAVFGLLAAFVLGAIAAGVILLTRRGGRKSRIPFGPFLALGWLIALIVGEPLVQWYLSGTGVV